MALKEVITKKAMELRQEIVDFERALVRITQPESPCRVPRDSEMCGE